MRLPKNDKRADIQLDPLTWLKIRTYIAVIGWEPRPSKGLIQADAGRLERMLRRGQRDCVISGDFLCFFKDNTLTHIIQKMELIEVEDEKFINEKLYKYNRKSKGKGKDQLIHFSRKMNKGNYEYTIDLTLLEEDEIYYLAPKLGRPARTLSSRRFYFKNGQLFEIFDLRSVHRFEILENERIAFDELRHTTNLRDRLKKNEKISLANKSTYQENCLWIFNHLKKVIQSTGLNVDAQKIIDAAPSKQLGKIIANINEITLLYEDGRVNPQMAMKWLIKYGLVKPRPELKLRNSKEPDVQAYSPEDSQNKAWSCSTATEKDGDDRKYTAVDAITEGYDYEIYCGVGRGIAPRPQPQTGRASFQAPGFPEISKS